MPQRSRRGRPPRSKGETSPSVADGAAQNHLKVERRARLRGETLEALQSILPFIGGVFIVFGLLEFVFLLAPMDFMNPLWEIRLYGQLVDHVWGPLFGMALVLVPLSSSISVNQLKIRAFISWLALLLAACYLLLIPFGLVTANRIYTGLKQVRDTELEERYQALNTAMEILYDLDNLESIKRFGSALGMKESFWAEPQLDKLKQDLESKYTQLHNERVENMRQNYTTQVRSLAITAVKSTIGAVIAAFALGFLFFRTVHYRGLLKQDAIGKGSAAGITTVRRNIDDEAENGEADLPGEKS